MNPQPHQDLERGLQKLEAEINQTPPQSVLQPKQTLQTQPDRSQPVQSTLNQIINWFNNLSGFGKLLFVGVAAIIGLAILQAVLKLVTAVITLALLGVIVYFVYQYFLSNRSKTKD